MGFLNPLAGPVTIDPDSTVSAVTGSVGSVVGNVGGSVGSVVGGVGSVLGNVGGNVNGSVANVIGNVGGSTASVVGNVGGNVAGSVASVSGSVGGSVGSVLGTVGSVTGSVGSVAGNVSGSTGSIVGDVGGNVVGSVGSVTGNVGGSVASVLGAVGSVTGSVASVTGNVAGSVNIVIGSVGSVTGNIGGNMAGSVGSVTGNVSGSVASVLGNIAGSVASVLGSVTTSASSIIAQVSDSVPFAFRDGWFWPCASGEQMAPTRSAGATYTQLNGYPAVSVPAASTVTYPFMPRLSFAGKQVLTVSGVISATGMNTSTGAPVGSYGTFGIAQTTSTRYALFEIFNDQLGANFPQPWLRCRTQTDNSGNLIQLGAAAVGPIAWKIVLRADGFVEFWWNGVKIYTSPAARWLPTATDQTPFIYFGPLASGTYYHAVVQAAYT